MEASEQTAMEWEIVTNTLKATHLKMAYVLELIGIAGGNIHKEILSDLYQIRSACVCASYTLDDACMELLDARERLEKLAPPSSESEETPEPEQMDE